MTCESCQSLNGVSCNESSLRQDAGGELRRAPCAAARLPAPRAAVAPGAREEKGPAAGDDDEVQGAGRGDAALQPDDVLQVLKLPGVGPHLAAAAAASRASQRGEDNVG